MTKVNDQNSNLLMTHKSDKSSVLLNILKGFEDFTLDINGKILSSNLEAVNITGYEEWEVIGKNFSVFYTDQERLDKLPENDLTKAREHSLITFSAWRVKKRGVSFWAQITLKCLRDFEGSLTGYKLILKDQTHKLISRDRVKKYRDEYLNLFNNPFIGVFKFRKEDFKFVLINTAAIRILGPSNREKFKFSETFIDNQDFANFNELLNANSIVTGFEFQINSKERERWARLDCKLFVADGFVEGIVTDITQNKKQVVELQRLNAELDSFIYHASHDLRSPLSSLLGLINLSDLDHEGLNSKVYNAMMRERINYLDELLKDLATITYNNKTGVEIEEVDFENTIDDILNEYIPKYSTVQVEKNINNISSFQSDEKRIHIVLKNLISNAFKYHNPDNPNPYVRILIDQSEDKVMIKIEDNGLGIGDDHLMQIFGMFYRASADANGTGLGLYITKLILNKLSGEIKVRSKIGRGTQFLLELPSLSHQHPK